MANKVIRIDAQGKVDSARKSISIKDGDTAQWVSTGNKEWLVIFRGNCPFTDRDFAVPAQGGGSSRLGHQCSGLQAGESYVYDVVARNPGKGKKGSDPIIDIKP